MHLDTPIYRSAPPPVSCREALGALVRLVDAQSDHGAMLYGPGLARAMVQARAALAIDLGSRAYPQTVHEQRLADYRKARRRFVLAARIICRADSLRLSDEQYEHANHVAYVAASDARIARRALYSMEG